MCAKWLAYLSVDHEPQVDGEVRQREKVISLEDGRELARDSGSVEGAHPEGDEGPGVPEDRISDLGLKLGEVLVGQDHVESVLAQLRQHGGQRKCGEGVELVEVEVEVPALLVRPVGPLHRCEGKVGD